MSKITLDSVLRKVARPPAPQNWVRLLVKDDLRKTAGNIANLALGIPAFNYVPGGTACRDRVAFKMGLETALKAVSRTGAPAGREENAAFVRAFFQYDEARLYSAAKYLESYYGSFPISREVKIPTKPTFTILENERQVPIVVCGWKKNPLTASQKEIVMSLYESGLFSYGDYRRSPAEVLFFPEEEMLNGEKVRVPQVWRRGEGRILSSGELRDLIDFYARAQELAEPLIRDKWKQREEARRRKEETQREEADQTLILPLFDLLKR